MIYGKLIFLLESMFGRMGLAKYTVNLDSACITNMNGESCFCNRIYDTKPCSNSPSFKNSHALC